MESAYGDVACPAPDNKTALEGSSGIVACFQHACRSLEPTGVFEEPWSASRTGSSANAAEEDVSETTCDCRGWLTQDLITSERTKL